MNTLEDVLVHTVRTRWNTCKDGERPYKHCREFLIWLGGRHCASVPTKTVEGYRAALVRAGLSAGSINRRLSAVGTLLSAAQEMGVVKVAPKIRRQKEPQGRLRTLTPVELEVIRGRLSRRSLPLFHWLSKTGMRLGEALALQRKDLDSEETGPHSETVTATIRDSKSGFARTVPLSEELRRIVWPSLIGLSPDRPVIAVSARTFQADFRDAVYKALGPAGMDVCVHTLRHTCATNLVRKGVPLATVARLLGHRNIQTTMRYAHTSVGDLQAAVDQL